MNIRRWHMLILMGSVVWNAVLLPNQNGVAVWPRAKKNRTNLLQPKKTGRRFQKGGNTWLGHFVGEIPHDMLSMGRNIFLWNTFKVVSFTFPLFIAASMIDGNLQPCFYEKKHHKNINQMPSWCYTLANYSIELPLLFLGLDGLLSKDLDKFYTAKLLLIGSPFVVWTKDIMRELHFDACVRPWSQYFSSEKRSYGGFPSGHMAQAMYATMLYSLRYGIKYAVPLGALSTFLAVTFISRNRHYLSQIVAGAGFGTIYAFAASAVVDSKLHKHFKLGMSSNGLPQVSLSFRF